MRSLADITYSLKPAAIKFSANSDLARQWMRDNYQSEEKDAEGEVALDLERRAQAAGLRIERWPKQD